MKKIVCCVLSVIMSFFMVCPVYAEEIDYTEYIKVVNNHSGQEVEIEVKNITEFVNESRSSMSRSGEVAYSKEIQVEFDIPELMNSNSRSSIDSSKNHGDFVAYLRVDYEVSGTNALPKVKVTSVQGSWSCNASGYTARFENKDVLLKQGNWLLDNCTLQRNPTSNSFYYTTGWGYVDDLPRTDYSGVYAISTAIAIIDGMGGGYTLEVQVSK